MTLATHDGVHLDGVRPGDVQPDDARACGRIVREHARTFWTASLFLPAAKRRAAFALYAFCRLADDLVDVAAVGDAPAGARSLAAYERRLEAALAGRPADAVFRELAGVVRCYAVPPDVLRELLAGIARDLAPARYRDWAELGRYCEGVASTVGEMCTHVFGVPGGPAARDRALRYARTLGVAMQLTNILRDVGEDARRGRCYLPEDELAAAGLSVREVLDAGDAADRAFAADPRWTGLMRAQVARARALYAAAAPGIRLLAPDTQRCAAACATGYAAILAAIERRRYDTLSARARVGAAERGAILWRVWRGADDRPAPVGDGPSVSWAPDAPRPTRSRTVA